jgi:pyruvoyl-dependent arginine decarboxylase
MHRPIYNFAMSHHTFFLVSGAGTSNVSKLNAFDFALIDAGVGDFNIIRLSSILPPNFTQIVPATKPIAGSLLPMAYAKALGDDIHKIEIIGAAIGVGIPKDKDLPGLIMEHTLTQVVTFKNSPPLTSDIPEEDTYVAGAAERKIKWQRILESHIRAMVEEGMKKRGAELEAILTKCAVIENKKNEKYIAAFAGVVLW